MKTLQQELQQGIIKSVYLLCGGEAYLKRQYMGRIQNACVPQGDTMNCNRYEGKGIPIGEVIDLAQTMPFFAEKRLIIMKDTGLFRGGSDEIAEYISELPPTTCLLFVEEDVDKRTRLYKAVKKHGKVVEFKAQDERTLTVWITSMFNKEKRQIAPSTIRFLLERVGTDMDLIYQEVEKLVCYTYGRDAVTVEDIQNVCSVQISNQIFEMINAMAERKPKRALDLYYDLLSLKEAPLKILALINRQFNLLMQVKDLARLGRDKGEIASIAGLPPFVVGKYIAQARGFTMEGLRIALEDSVQTEEDVKMGRIADRLGVELLIVKYSQGN